MATDLPHSHRNVLLRSFDEHTEGVRLGGGSVSCYFTVTGHNTALAVTNNASGTLLGLELVNDNDGDAWCQMYNQSSAGVTVGTTSPRLSFLVPGKDSNGRQDGTAKAFPYGLRWESALSVAFTTTPDGAGDPSEGIVGNFIFINP